MNGPVEFAVHSAVQCGGDWRQHGMTGERCPAGKIARNIRRFRRDAGEGNQHHSGFIGPARNVLLAVLRPKKMGTRTFFFLVDTEMDVMVIFTDGENHDSSKQEKPDVVILQARSHEQAGRRIHAKYLYESRPASICNGKEHPGTRREKLEPPGDCMIKYVSYMQPARNRLYRF